MKKIGLFWGRQNLVVLAGTHRQAARHEHGCAAQTWRCSSIVRSRLELAAFEARVRVLELDQTRTDYERYRATARVHLRDLMAAYAQSAAPLQAPVMLCTIVLTAAPALRASEREHVEAGKTAKVDVSTAAGAGAAQGSTS
jgi:hypothetical protein